MIEIDSQSPSGLSRNGCPVGTVDKKTGYYRVWYKGKLRSAGQVILELSGQPKPSPRHECDHIDRDNTNNNLENLRWATRKQQLLNRKGWTSTGFKYAYIEKTGKAYYQFRLNGKRFKRRGFSTIQEAYLAALAARLELSWI
jgi:hypothetical protein